MPRACPACLEETNTTLVETLEDCSFYQCAVCGLQYADPIPDNVPVFQDFTDCGLSLLSGLQQGRSVACALAPNERLVLHWLRRNIRRNAAILELCCESGRFLAALDACGFEPLGMDPLSRPIAMLRERGFTVEVGFAEDYPRDWPEPAAVVLLESLVRFPAPTELLGSIRERFSQAAVCCSVPSPRRSLKVPEFDKRVDYPPHRLTRWTPRALQRAMEHAGYRGKCRVAHVDLHWRRGSWRARALKILFALSLRLIGESEYSIIGIGFPSRKSCLSRSKGEFHGTDRSVVSGRFLE